MSKEWKKILFNENMIKARSAKSVMIAMPNKSAYKGFAFWHPASLVRQDWVTYRMSFSYTDGFVFKLKKYGKGRYNAREVIEDVNIGPGDMEDAFAMLNEFEPDEDYEEPLIHTPERLEPEHATAIEELIDND